jgi:hypothetical protein
MKQLLLRFREFLNESIWRKRILYSMLGASGGYAYYYFIGCSSGTCPITGNPDISTLYGAGMGFFLTVGEKKRVQPDQNETSHPS